MNGEVWAIMNIFFIIADEDNDEEKERRRRRTVPAPAACQLRVRSYTLYTRGLQRDVVYLC